MQRSTNFLVLVLVVIVAAACRTVPESGSLDFRGGTWRLIDVNAAPAIPEEISARPWLRFESDSQRVSANFGCNMGGGSYTAGPERALRFDQIITTLRACADQQMNAQEAALTSALRSTDRYSMSGDTLQLRQGERVLARFVRP